MTNFVYSEFEKQMILQLKKLLMRMEASEAQIVQQQKQIDELIHLRMGLNETGTTMVTERSKRND